MLVTYSTQVPSIIGTGYDTAGGHKYHRPGNILLSYQTKNIVEPFLPRIALFYCTPPIQQPNLFLSNPFCIFEQLPRTPHQITTCVILSTMQVQVLVMKTQSSERQTWYFIHFYIPLLSDQVQFSDVRYTRLGGIGLANDGHEIPREIEVALTAAECMIELSRAQV